MNRRSKRRRRDKARPVDRRRFLRDSARATAGLVLAPGLLAVTARAGEAPVDPPTAEGPTGAPAPEPAARARPAGPADLSIVTGPDPFQSTLAALELLGGIERFVKPGDRVGLLVNAWKTNPGTYTRPELALAVAQLCFDAGAKQVVMLKDQGQSYFELMEGYETHAKLIAKIAPAESDYRVLPVEGKVLRKAEVLDKALDFERLINLPIVKDHSGCKMTGTLKNMMGITHYRTNMAFHLGPNPTTTFLSNVGDMFPDIAHFAYCVADLYSVRRPDLCVLDAFEFITTNGPGGPGKLARPHQVLAGTDPVMLDALCVEHLGLKPSDVELIVRAHELGVGRSDPSSMRIARRTLG